MTKMKVLLWGAGTIGGRFIKHLNKDSVVAYIDSSMDRIGGSMSGKPIISFEDYLERYSDCYVIITGYYYQEQINALRRAGIYRYFWCMDCPGEWLDEDERVEFEEHIEKKIKDADQPVVYGCNYYSLCLAKRIYEKTGILPAIAYNDYYDADFINQIKNDYPELKVDKLCDLEYVDIYITEDRRIGFNDELLNKDTKVVECWDCAFEIDSYWNPEILQFKNIHKGRRCFVIGTGPSLRVSDLDILHNNNEICFSMNEIFTSFKDTAWRPDYYFVSDTEGIMIYSDYMKEMDTRYIFFSDQLGRRFNEKLEKAIGERFIRYHIHRSTSMDLLPLFTDDFAKSSYYGYTVTYIILQFAAYMGFKQIYLLGIDATGAAKGYGMCSYGSFNEVINNGRFTEPYNTHAYMAARDYAEQHGFKIHNATRGGELEVFDRVEFDSLF